MTRWRDKLNDDERGFTIAELVFAMLVITVVLLALMAAQTSALVSIAESGRRQQATAYANEAMEQLRSMPWNVLRKGLANNFVTASGGDSNVSGTTLTLDGVPEPEPLIVAPAGSSGAAQVLAKPWPPLFDGSGSNKTIETLASQPNIQYEVRTYITQGLGGAGTIGMIVYITWTDLRTGATQSQTFRSTAYAPSGGCGDLDNQPFLSSCQARLSAAANSGSMVTTVGASITDISTGLSTPLPILPGSAQYTLAVTSSEALATSSSQQVTLVDAFLHYGGEQWADVNDNSLGSRGLEQYDLAASDNLASPDAPPLNPANITVANSQGSLLTWTSVTEPGLELIFRSDRTRAGVADASSTVSCLSGVPAGEPCAMSTLAGSTGNSVRLSYTNSLAEKFILYPYRRDSGSATSSDAWVARFTTEFGSSATGCTTLSLGGCIAAGASNGSETYRFGYPESGGWGGAATEGVVYITGYTDSVKVQRGMGQLTIDPDYTRTGTLHYWTGSAYTDIALSTATNTSIPEGVIPDLTWQPSGSKLAVTAHVSFEIQPSYKVDSITDPDCRLDVCKVTGGAGSIIVRISYDVTLIDSGYTYTIDMASSLTGATASADYQSAPE